MSSRRVWAIIIVAILHAVLAFALVSGLAVKAVRSVQSDLNVFDVEEEEPPPPEEEPPPPPPDTPIPPPPVQIAPRIVPMPPRPVFQPPPRPVPQVPRPAPRPPPPPPPPPPPQIEPARARANLGSYISDTDYPSSASRNGESGTTGFRLTVGPNGRVTDCTITSSSGSQALDRATCNIMTRRARFEPATDSSGNAVTDTVSSAIRWVLPE